MSTDGGSVWTEIDSDYFTDGADMLTDPNSSGTIWTAGFHLNHMAVSRSTNWGGTWERDELSSQTGKVYSLAMDPENGSTVYAGGYESSTPAIYRTINAGGSWTKLSATGIAGYIYDLLIDPVDTSIIYAATANGVYKSTNGGNSFSKISGSLGFTKNLVMDPYDNSTIYAAAYGQGVWGTYDAGSTWESINDGLEELLVNAVAVNPDEWLFAGTDSIAAFRYDIEVGIGESGTASPEFSVLFTSPNPARNSAVIHYQLAEAGSTRVSIYDMTGRLVTTLVDGSIPAGEHSVVWDAANESPGIYFLRMTTETEVLSSRLVLIR
jgi:photosystem II stability/assembly factor-like uncharacterized protein